MFILPGLRLGINGFTFCWRSNELFWIIGLALYVAIEKLFKNIYWLDKALGLLLIGFGSFLLI